MAKTIDKVIKKAKKKGIEKLPISIELSNAFGIQAVRRQSMLGVTLEDKFIPLFTWKGLRSVLMGTFYDELIDEKLSKKAYELSLDLFEYLEENGFETSINGRSLDDAKSKIKEYSEVISKQSAVRYRGAASFILHNRPGWPL